LQGHEEEFYPELVARYGENKPATQWNKRMTALAWRLHPATAIPHLKQRAADASLPQEERRAALTALAFINNKAAADAMVALSKNGLQDVAEDAAYWVAFRQSNDWYSLLDWSRVGLNTAYERKVAQMKVKQSLALDVHQSNNERKWRVQEMARDSVGGQMLIGLAAEKKLPSELVPFIEDVIFQNPNATVRMQAGDYFKRPGTAAIFSIAHILKLTPDAARGKMVFTKYCASCHKVGNEGSSIGPELTTIGRKFAKPELLDAIINPSAAIVFGYEPWLVNTKDGESLYGFLLSENKQTVVLKDIAGQKHVIPVAKISKREKQERSLMPDPASNGMTEQQLADVAEYLRDGRVAAAH
jgi:putative heme-binding domain-containing protein